MCCVSDFFVAKGCPESGQYEKEKEPDLGANLHPVSGKIAMEQRYMSFMILVTSVHQIFL